MCIRDRRSLALLLGEWKKDPQKWEDECKAAGPTGEADIDVYKRQFSYRMVTGMRAL